MEDLEQKLKAPWENTCWQKEYFFPLKINSGNKKSMPVEFFNLALSQFEAQTIVLL